LGSPSRSSTSCESRSSKELSGPLGDLDFPFSNSSGSCSNGNNWGIALRSNDPSADITKSLFEGWLCTVAGSEL